MGEVTKHDVANAKKRMLVATFAAKKAAGGGRQTTGTSDRRDASTDELPIMMKCL